MIQILSVDHLRLLTVGGLVVAAHKNTLRVGFASVEDVLALRQDPTSSSVGVVLQKAALLLVFAELLEVSRPGAVACGMAVSHGLILVVKLLQLHFVLIHGLRGARLDEIVDGPRLQLLVHRLHELLRRLRAMEHHCAWSLRLQIGL